MTVVIDTSTTTTAQPVFAGRSRWAAAALVTVGAALQVAEFVLESAPDTSAARLAWWQDHQARLEASQIVGLLAVPFLIGGFAVMVALTRRTSPRLAGVAAVALTFAMSGLAAIHGLEQAERMTAANGHPDAALGIMDAAGLGGPGIALLVMFLGGALVGTVTVYVAMWRSPLVPRAAVFLGVAFVVLDIGLGRGVIGHLAALGSGLVLAWAVVTGYVRAPRTRHQHGSH
jgi:hypothetical protein